MCGKLCMNALILKLGFIQRTSTCKGFLINWTEGQLNTDKRLWMGFF